MTFALSPALDYIHKNYFIYNLNVLTLLCDLLLPTDLFEYSGQTRCKATPTECDNECSMIRLGSPHFGIWYEGQRSHAQYCTTDCTRYLVRIVIETVNSKAL